MSKEYIILKLNNLTYTIFLLAFLYNIAGVPNVKPKKQWRYFYFWELLCAYINVLSFIK